MRVDVLVVGGGPSGLIAAREAASLDPGLEVMLVERDRAIGSPVRCGEGIGIRGVSEFIDPTDAPWISRIIRRVIIRAPDGTEVPVAYGELAFILDRSKFEPALAAQAGAAGVEIRIATEATGLRRTAEGWAVQLRGPRGEETVNARIVVGADGVESMIGRWAGLDTRVAARDMESCAQYVVSGIDFDPDALYLHFGDQIAPSGYAWVFPKGIGVANVGLGIIAHKGDGRSARQYLDGYLGRYFPTGTVSGFTVGGVIVHHTAKRIVTDALLLCGDAAHQVNPLSGGGISSGMKAGRLAARTAVAALHDGDTSAARLQRYHEEWMDLLGNDHVRFWRIKEALNKLDDAFYDKLARTLLEIPAEKRTMARVFAKALIGSPALFPVIARYFL